MSIQQPRGDKPNTGTSARNIYCCFWSLNPSLFVWWWEVVWYGGEWSTGSGSSAR